MCSRLSGLDSSKRFDGKASRATAVPVGAPRRHRVWLVLSIEGWGPNQTWRNVIALVASLYLTISIPVFFFESSQMRWLGRHHMLSMYAWPWAQWGYALVLGGVVGSFFGRGRARVAFATGAILLLILRLGMGIWVY